jgi:hypothetical protein
MPILFYLPLIILTGLIEIALTAHEPDEGNAPQPTPDPAAIF